jgi:NAD-dependent deacetylase
VRLRAARHAIALTGAGISVESGIPDFRSPGGLWTVFRPEEYATIEVFRANPAKAWRLYRALGQTLAGCTPNPAHRALAALEQAGLLRLVVTQNIDGLHQAAGSRTVIEIHGDHRRLQCLRCGRLEEARPERLAGWCRLRRLRRAAQAERRALPGGQIAREPQAIGGREPLRSARESARTSAQVYPAAAIPVARAGARGRGGAVIEFNVRNRALHDRDDPPDFFFRGPAGRPPREVRGWLRPRRS